jgi:hypothetical protein
MTHDGCEIGWRAAKEVGEEGKAIGEASNAVAPPFVED